MADEKKCPRCGEAHEIIECPHLKAIEFEDGYVFGAPSPPRVHRLEFLTPADYVAAPRGSTDQQPAPDYPKKVAR